MNWQDRSIRPCPCCGEWSATPAFDNRMVSIDRLNMSYTVSYCNACGFLYASELPSGEMYAYYYQTLSKYDQVTALTQISIADLTRARAAVELCRSSCLPYDAPVADLGCGSGLLLHIFQEEGWSELYGLDPALGAREHALKLFGLNGVRSGLLADVATLLPLERIRLVCFTGVLEHLWNLREDLAALIRKLPIGTLILVEVPALERFTRPPIEPYGEFSLEHIQYFSTASLSHLFARLGATTLTTTLLDLPEGTTDSILGLFQKDAVDPLQEQAINATDMQCNDIKQLSVYIERSQEIFENALERIISAPRPWIIYGAGSHTARLLPILSSQYLDKEIHSIVDSNTNLIGKTIGCWRIDAPETIAENPDVTVIISSFRSQELIKVALESRYPNPLILLYK